MTTRYANGYGLRARPPECVEPPHEVDCSCCGGSGEHLFGEGMDAGGASCIVCEGEGRFFLLKLERAGRSALTNDSRAAMEVIKL